MTCFHNKCPLVPWQMGFPFLPENLIKSEYTSHLLHFPPLIHLVHKKSLRSCILDGSYRRASLF